MGGGGGDIMLTISEMELIGRDTAKVILNKTFINISKSNYVRAKNKNKNLLQNFYVNSREKL